MTAPLRRTTRPFAAACALAALGAIGCDALFAPPKEPVAPPSPPPPPAPETCASWKPSGPVDTPSGEDLRALLGKLEASPEVARLVGRLGAPRITKRTDTTVHTHERYGLQLVFRAAPAGNRLDSVHLHGRAAGAGGFAGALPEGLSFTQTEAEANKALGGPERRHCWSSGCRYQDRGITVWTDRRDCLATVEMTRGLAKNHARIEDLEIRENVEDGGAHGVAIDATISTPQLDGYTGATTMFCLEDDSGNPVEHARWATRPFHEHEPFCVPLHTPGFAPTARGRAFVPYVLLGRPRGPSVLRGRFRSTLNPYRTSLIPQQPEVQLVQIGDSRVDAPVTLPEIARARVTVKSARVKKGISYDDIRTGVIAAAVATGGASLLVPIPDRWAKPDLQWSLYVAGKRAHRSGAHQDTYSASWSSGGSVPLAPGDRFTLCLEDSDGLDTLDRIACFDFTMETYLAQLASGKPLSEGNAEALVLGPAARK